jgi:LPXTG-site transpeptidase (sortase) family protein
VEPAAPDPTVPRPPVPPEVEDGDAIARIELPSIGVDRIVVAGVDKDDLKKGPGHYPETPLPGQLGNAAIAGHRTTFGQPFIDVDQLQVDDEIVVTTLAGRYVYRVTGQQIVSPRDSHVIATTDPTTATLTLTSCHPKYSARERIIIFSELDEEASDGGVTEATINYGRSLDADPSTAANPDPTNTVFTIDDGLDDGLEQAQNDEDISDAFSEGWFSDPGCQQPGGTVGDAARPDRDALVPPQRRTVETGSGSSSASFPSSWRSTSSSRTSTGSSRRTSERSRELFHLSRVK